MSKRNVRRGAVVAGVVMAALCAIAALCGDRLVGARHTYEPYRLFYEQVQTGSIESVTIGGDQLRYRKKDTDGQFCTDNPQSPQLREQLLLHDVMVTEQKDGVQIVSMAMDVLFYAFFVAVIVLAFRKFISPNTFRAVRRTGVTFDDVVGLDALKRDMLQVVDVMRRPAEYARRGIRMPKGILLEGAPGNGKTLFARAVAGQAGVPFIAAKATDFESMFMAIGPLKVKLLFRKARRKAPCIVFIDEFDGIGTRRNYTGSAIETENTRIVTALLNELDGFEPTQGVLVLAATNSIAALDEALIRPGRFDARFCVPYPGPAEREALVRLCCRQKPLDPPCTAETLARSFDGFSCAKIESVLNRAALIATQQGRAAITQDDVDAALAEQNSAR